VSTLAHLETAVEVTGVHTHLFRAEVEYPMITSFGVLSQRPALFVEVESVEGIRGWGEVWCNFPAFVEEHRWRFASAVVAPMLVGRRFAEPADATRLLNDALGIQAIQAAEEGTLASVAAAFDQALWDLIGRRNEEPLWRLLGGRQLVPVCASGIEPTRAEATIEEGLGRGHTAFKLKAGFDDAIDIRTLGAARAAFGDAVDLMVDANQAWSVRHALEVTESLAVYRPLWIEEPIRATEPVRVWRELSRRSPIPLAAGENIRSEQTFNDLVTGGAIRHVQPDVGKWGGITGCVTLGRWAVRSGQALYSPHWVGGGIGLAHTLHALAAVGGGGRAELDVTPNPLRDRLYPTEIWEGCVELSESPGVGPEPNLADLAEYRVKP
jgi:D-galactarolactone cycloisomerase